MHHLGYMPPKRMKITDVHELSNMMYIACQKSLKWLPLYFHFNTSLFLGLIQKGGTSFECDGVPQMLFLL